ncbi:beta-1,3-glucosyltransferase [Nonlabens ulvanivorans]|nr:glycosyltransferase family A protein [Nonlabens ulvanivorans]GAK93160.1 beta-1,3-glucosyltransferase [Nonlabens ulvanivorans]
MAVSNTLVSIIVPCYKQAHFLDESLLSVFNQSYDRWECIIVNDGSPDNTDQVAAKWCEKDQRFKYVSKENGGLSSARNTGIKKSNGSYILPLDADDALHKDYLSKLVPVLESNKDLGIVSCYTSIFRGTTSNVIDELKPFGSAIKDLLYQNQLIATSLYRKVLWEQVGGYDESMKNGFEDWEFWIAVTKQNKFYKIVPEFLFFYRKAVQSMLVDTIKSHFEDNKEYIIKKHKEVT